MICKTEKTCKNKSLPPMVRQRERDRYRERETGPRARSGSKKTGAH